MKVEWGAAQKTFRDLVAQSGHELGVFRVDGYHQTGLGYTVRKVPCKRCGRVFTITFSPVDAFTVKPDDLHGRCNSSELNKVVSTKKRCCGHPCPVCGAPARPLDGFSRIPGRCQAEGDVPWRVAVPTIRASANRFPLPTTRAVSPISNIGCSARFPHRSYAKVA